MTALKAQHSGPGKSGTAESHPLLPVDDGVTPRTRKASHNSLSITASRKAVTARKSQEFRSKNRGLKTKAFFAAKLSCIITS
jgi:hypothetical protein